MSQSTPFKFEFQQYLTYLFLITTLVFRISCFFLFNWLILFDFCSDFISTVALVISTGTQTNEANGEIET